MAEMGTLHDAFLDELRDTYDAEKQITKALPKMVKAAASPALRDALEAHLEETQQQVERLEQVFASLDEKATGKHCAGMAGIIEEGQSILEEDFDETTTDACLIAAAQRVEHYEMAAYGTLVSWARVMGHTEAADLLEETLDEEKAADATLSSIAKGGINQAAAEAADEGEGDEEADDEEEEGHRGTVQAHLTRLRSLHRHDLDVTFTANDGDAEVVGVALELQIDARVADRQVGQADPVDRLGQPAP